MAYLIVEIIAVITAILYLMLAAREDVKCWYAAIISSALYFYIMYKAGLLMEAYLQIFYIIMALYGWLNWTNLVTFNKENKIRVWDYLTHLLAIGIIISLALVSGLLLEKYTNAALPFIDALTTWGAIVTTYMVAQKILENWIYWFVIDTISIYLFMSRGLYITSILFFIYLIIICFGYASWKKKYKAANDQY
tara:strand:+ start:385 stop:963 length:579 start_codon:yes stop_codon:yes gene_type:complete